MRIVLDLQSLQTESRYRGIGRYSLSLTKAMITEGQQHEFVIILNHSFPDTVAAIQQIFANLLPPENIMLFRVPTPIAEANPNNHWRCQVAELIREHFIQQLHPDLVHISSLLVEGLNDDAVTSIGRFANLPTSVTLYDLIPHLHPEHYLANTLTNSWYMRKLAHLRNAELLLAISEHTRREAIEVLGLPSDRIVNISSDADVCFRVLELNKDTIQTLKARYGLSRDFVLYTGSLEYHKNVVGLIEAYAGLPVEVRTAHQLVICCKVPEDERLRISQLTSRLELSKDEVVLTGYVSDEDLVALYNLCKLFVLPSLHEGFGLPLLEAIRCGAPVIGSNLSSIPEVLDYNAALFDPASVSSIHDKLYQALTDDQFRQRLREHEQLQSSKFSWNISAKRALEAFEALHERQQFSRYHKVQVPANLSKPRLAYFSPLPPEKSEITNYSAELLPELVKYYDIHLITDLSEIADPWLVDNLRRYSVAEYRRHAQEYDRVLYQFGDSPFHSHMFSLLPKYPGTVVLHDFFLSSVLRYLEDNISGPAIFREALYRSHGYPALQCWHEKGPEEALRIFPSCLEVLRSTQGVIVHSEFSLKLAERFFSHRVAEHLLKILPLHRLPKYADRADSRKVLNLSEQAFVVCSFGILATTKLNDRLLSAWLDSDLAYDQLCYLIFVGDGQGTAYEQSLRQQIESSGNNHRIIITGYTSSEMYRHYLTAADVAVQLRTDSRGESSRVVYDCLAYGLATVVNNHGTLTELPAEVVIKLPEEFTNIELAESLKQLYHDPTLRKLKGDAAVNYVKTYLDPAQIAYQYAKAIESFAQNHPVAIRKRLLSAIVALPTASKPRDVELARVAEALGENISLPGYRNLLVDITSLTRADLRTGIQRVTRSVLQQLLAEAPASYRVEPVYHLEGIYRYARHFTDGFIGINNLGLDDAPVEVAPGDLFLGLDLDADIDEAAKGWLRYHARRGLKIYYVIYDLLPVLRQDWFPLEMHALFKVWLEDVASLTDGVVCISRTTAATLGQWLTLHPVVRTSPLLINYFHLGANIEASRPTNGVTAEEAAIITQMTSHTSILMVGTIEPRKGYDQAVEAFELLWDEGEDVLLVIVGKEGWMTKILGKRLRAHPELGKHLIWFEQASDELLSKLYHTNSALLMASEGEGFGLPLIEAALHGLPIIARDLPVFQEVAGDHAFYFTGTESRTLADALKTWLELYRRGDHPRSDGMRVLTWEESTRQLKQILFESCWMASWDPSSGFQWYDDDKPLDRTPNEIVEKGES